MINRVFCYSDEEAKKNGNSVSIGKMLLQIIVMVLLMIIVMFVCFAISHDFMDNPLFFLLFIFGFTILIICYAINFNLKFHSQLTGFAIDTENNIYLATKLNNGEEFVIGGMAAGEIIDKVLGKSNSFSGDLVQGVGTAMTLYTLKKSAKIMQNPEIIAKMVESANTTTGAEVRQLLKVYNYTENTHKVKIKCDYRIMRNGKVKCNKTMNIYKSYNCYNELINIILNRGN